MIIYLSVCLTGLIWIPKVSTVYSPSDAYQESILRPIRSFSDVAIFHYSVPTQTSKASWTFVAFSDDPSCDKKAVNVHLRYGSYPVITVDNTSFPDNVVLPKDLDETDYSIKAFTQFPPNDMPQINILNPLPGSWFAAAFIISDGNEAIQQEGLSKKCHYSLGSMASWSQELNVHLLTPSIPVRVQSQDKPMWFKFFVPENTLGFRYQFSDCDYSLTNSTSGEVNDECHISVGISAESLPFLGAHQNLTNYILSNSSNTYSHTVTQPQVNVYYYIGLKSNNNTEFTFVVTIKECEMFVMNSDWFPTSVNFGQSSTRKAAKSSMSLAKYVDVVQKFISTKQAISSSPTHLNPYPNPTCLPILALTRIKHAQEFLDSFLFQGKDWFSSRVNLQCSKPVYVRFEILPFIDIGGTLVTKFTLDGYTQSLNTSRNISLNICVKHQRPPPYSAEYNSIPCPHERLSMRLEAGDESKTSTMKLIPFPKPGTWYISLQAVCSNCTGHNDSECDKPLRLDLKVRLQPCLTEQCGGHGFCKENHFRHFYFSSCHCTNGWKGWGCTDGGAPLSRYLSLLQTLLLILSNLFFIPAICIAIKWRFYAEAVVYIATMFFSSFYHACDTENIRICLFKYDVLQFCDFYSAILSFWVTIVAMSGLPLSISSMAHMAGALGIALGVQSEKTGLWTFVVPVGTGIAIMLISWGNQFWHSKAFRLRRKLLNLLPGTAFVITGLILFAFLETEGNYKYIHSAWHSTIALSITFLLPRNSEISETKVEETNGGAMVSREETQPKDSEMVDISEYRLNSDLTTLLSTNKSPTC